MRRAPVLTKVLVSVVLMWGALFAYEYARLPNLYAMQKSTVEIQIVDEKTGEVLSHCSGVYLGGKYVLTAGHCLSMQEGTLRQVRSFNGDRYVGVEESAWDWKVPTGGGGWESDLGLIRLRRELDARPAYISCDKPALGETLYAVGMPRMLQWAVTKGEVFSTIPRPNWPKDSWVQLDMTIIGGNSGGPVFNKWGEVVGIISHTLQTPNYGGLVRTNHAFAVSGPKMCEFLGKS